VSQIIKPEPPSISQEQWADRLRGNLALASKLALRLRASIPQSSALYTDADALIRLLNDTKYLIEKFADHLEHQARVPSEKSGFDA